MENLRLHISSFAFSENGASLVEYAVALTVVIIIGGVIFNFGDAIATVINVSAGAF